jgi:dienelactone hydrolase
VLRFIRYAMSAVIVAAAFAARAQTDTFGLDAGQHSVGFQLIETQDPSRIVSGGAPGATHARPVRVYLWYPATASRRAPPLRFGRYAELADDDIWPAAIAGEARERLRFANGPLARSLSTEDMEALMARPMRAVEDAEPLHGPFPLLVIGLGLHYESPVTFAAFAEYLAGAGFAVATAPLVGTDVAIVKIDGQDLETQVRDLEFVIARVRELPFVHRERLGVLGFDMGGMAGLLLTMRNRGVDAFVSLDAGIQYPHESGQPRASPHYDALALRVPWLHAANLADGPPRPAVKSLFDEAEHSDRYWLRAQELGHADFTSVALVEGRRTVPGYWAAVTPARTAGHRVVAEYVRHFFAAYVAESDVSNALFDQALREPPTQGGITLEHRAATPPPIGYGEVVRKLIDGESAEAIGALRSLAASAPDHWLLAESTFTRLWISLFYTWNLAEQVLPLVALANERYPESPGAKAMLGETQAALGNYPAAIAAYEQVLAQSPGNADIAARLETLRSQR